MSAPPVSPSDPPLSPVRPRLEFLDGLRGAAAFYVVLHHVYHQIDWRGDGGGLSPLILRLSKTLAYGEFAVGVFIVLSGYCLMLPVARSADGKMRGGIGSYLYRRARRILPPYYAAVMLVLLLIALTPGLQHRVGCRWDGALPALEAGPILSHLLLVHNFFPQWAGAIDPPMWSVAVEWQIYFIFPLLLLPVWRRFGDVAFLATALLLACAVSVLQAHYHRDTALFFVAPFAVGMYGALVSFSPHPHYRRLREIAWGRVSVVLFLLLAGAALVRPGILMEHLLISLPLLGVVVIGMLIDCAAAAHPQSTRTPLALRVLEWRGLTFLGLFSYSLYLVHMPILALVHLPLRAHHLGPLARYGLLFLLGVPLSVVVAYLFHRVFERPFMSVPGRIAKPDTQ